MNREQFTRLPLSVALGHLWDALHRGDGGPYLHLEELPEYRSPLPPKFDQKLRVKDGYVWASECDLRELEYQHGRAMSPGKPEYAERNAKLAKGLSYWLDWRRAFPTDTWSGERDRAPCTAAAPRHKPAVHAWEPRGETAPQAPRAPLPKFDDEEQDDDMPF